MRNVKGQALSSYFLVELVLFAIVFLSVWTVVYGMAKNNTYFQGFYAKDNAHIIDALHAVPNGEVHMSYLWSTQGFKIGFKSDQVLVDIATQANTASKYERAKYFLKSTTTVEPKEYFTPQYYEFIRSAGANGKIQVQEHFNALVCPDASTPLNGMIGTGTGVATDGTDAQDVFKAVLSGVQTKHSTFRTDEGTRVELRFEQGSPATTVYYNSNDDQTVRLACLFAQQLSTPQQNAQYGHASINPQYALSNEQIIIVIKGLSLQKQDLIDRMRDAVVAYGAP